MTLDMRHIKTERKSKMYSISPEIQDLIDRGALFVVNHSGGKDSQAMMIKIVKLVPKDQILVIHADLPGADWPGTWDHVKATCKGYETVQVVAVKTLFDMARKRGMWPSPKYRQCTSDLKRGPIEKAIRHHIKNNDLSGLVVNAMGIRAEESYTRAKAAEFKFNKRNSKAGREWYDWLPIKDWKTTEVFSEIKLHGQVPHWAYDAGMERLSCCFCIMASESDLRTAARLVPDIYAEFVKVEREINFSFVMPKKGHAPRFLPEITGVDA